MRTRSENIGKVVWKENVVELLWHPNRELDNGQKIWVRDNFDKDILLTEEDLHFMPTQEDLRTYNYYAEEEIYNKLYKPYFELLTTKKDKVISKKFVLNKLER